MIKEVTRRGGFDMQVCMPKSSTDEEVIEFAETENPCGTQAGWGIRKEGSEYLAGAPERAQCEEHDDNVHITLDV